MVPFQQPLFFLAKKRIEIRIRSKGFAGERFRSTAYFNPILTLKTRLIIIKSTETAFQKGRLKKNVSVDTHTVSSHYPSIGVLPSGQTISLDEGARQMDVRERMMKWI